VTVALIVLIMSPAPNRKSRVKGNIYCHCDTQFATHKRRGYRVLPAMWPKYVQTNVGGFGYCLRLHQ